MGRTVMADTRYIPAAPRRNRNSPKPTFQHYSPCWKTGSHENFSITKIRIPKKSYGIFLFDPEFLFPYKTKFIEQVARIDQKEVRWPVSLSVVVAIWSDSSQFD